MDLHDFQRAAREMQELGGARERIRPGLAVDVRLELAARPVEGVRELTID